MMTETRREGIRGLKEEQGSKGEKGEIVNSAVHRPTGNIARGKQMIIKTEERPK